MTTHWQDTAEKAAKNMKKNDPETLILIGLNALAIFTVGVSLGFNLSNLNAEWVSGFWQNFSTEIMGAIVIFILFERILNRRKEDDKNVLEARQQRRLKILAGSRNNVIAVGALDELSAEGWLHLLQEEDVNLERANWQNAHLPGIELPKKCMSHINLEGASLRYANLEGADLQEANLQGAYLWDSNLQGADLQKANLEGAYLRDANLEGADLQKANLEGAYLWDSNLQGADLKRTNLEGAYLRYANLQGADLQKVNLEGAILWETNFEGADLSQTNLQGADLASVNLEGAILWEANLQGADLASVNLEGANLQKANLTYINTADVQCDENTTLPDGAKWTVNTDWTRFGVARDEDEWLTYRYQNNQPIREWFDSDEHMTNWLRKQGFIE